MTSIYDFTCKTSKGQPKTLKDCRQGAADLNIASKCRAITPQFEGLEALHARYAAKGLAISVSPPTSSAIRTWQRRRDLEFCQLG
ncbi:MAG: redoxin domain-containing protein [Gammaproteobacteria bacterium]|nr:redoxin domain-containing protein [Gammaproteobacteria bacterium]